MLIRIGTRGSKLALTQSEWIKNKIQDQHPDVRVELTIIKTTGDKIQDSPLSKIGGKGLFVKEIEDALLQNRVDLAVHSMKDVPAELPDGLMLAAFPEREDPRDALISAGNVPIHGLPLKARLGTSSLRRAAQILHIRPDLEIAPLRGNVDTRLGKLNGGGLDCIILATAGLNRMGLQNRISQVIPTNKILPAIGQGALGLETRQNDEQTIGIIDFLNHEPTQIAVAAERAFLKKLEGGCQVPIAGLALLESGRLHFTGMVAEIDGTRIIQDQISGDPEDAAQMGETLAGKLLDKGARKILENVYGRNLSNS
jgi:hydroxymethylbilane synthase